jgi:hypothetical protein
MAWNGLATDSVIFEGQKLLLRVTPPPTATLPATQTLIPSPTRPSPTASLTPGPTETPLPVEEEPSSEPSLGIIVAVIMLFFAGFLWWRFGRKNLIATESTEDTEKKE